MAIFHRLIDTIERKQSNLTLAADTTDGDALIALAEELGDHLCMLKTHIDMIENFTPSLPVKLQQLAKKQDDATLERAWKLTPGSLRSTNSQKLNNEDSKNFVRLYEKYIEHSEQVKKLAHGFGVSSRRNNMNLMYERCVKRIDQVTVDSHPQRERAGTIIDNLKLAESLWTPLKAFLWHMNRTLYEKGYGKLPKRSTLIRKFDTLSVSERQKYTVMAIQKRDEFPFIKTRLMRALYETNGDISWQTLSDAIDNWASKHTVRKWLMSKEGFRYIKQKFIPALNEAAVLKRKQYVADETSFWEKVEAMKLGVIEIHQDEKNFLGSVLHKNIKQTAEMKMKHQKIHHKNYQNKVMFSAFVGAASIGGYKNGIVGLPIHIERCCVERVWTKKSTYKRTYNGTSYRYEKRADNISKQQGKIYKVDCCVRGADTGTEKDPKYSLLKFWKEKLLPWLEKLVSTNGPFPGFIIKFQDDGAGAHQCKKYEKFLNELFDSKGWYLSKQPPNSPLTNVLDLLVFPALSKRVSHNKTQFNFERGCVRQMSKDEIEDVVLEEFEKLPVALIARAFATQKHVIKLIDKFNGLNGYIKERSALHSNVRYKFKVREGGAVSPYPIFQMATYGGRFRRFYEDQKV